MSYNRRTLSPDSPYAIVAAILLFMTVGILIITLAWNLPEISGKLLVRQYLLPGFCCLLLAVMFLSRKNSLIPTIPAMLACAAAFAMRTPGLPRWEFVCVCTFYGLFSLIYSLTVTGVLSSRNWLLGLSGSPFFFHLIVEDLILGTHSGFASFLSDVTVLLPAAALFAVGWGMRRGRLYH